jgi:tRNA threonylcarbamoyl adenosine modification protein (Sua5/YciO/YrdC/YwlC family)
MSQELKETWQKAKAPLLLHYTGSMFGLGCDARSEAGLAKISELKGRSINKGYIILLADSDELKKYDAEIDHRLAGLMRQYSPGALTVVISCGDSRIQHLSLQGKVAFRIPGDGELRKFLSSADIPLISTSINIAGEPPEIDYMRIIRNYKDWFDLALIPENELVAEGEPSTVVTEEAGKLVCLREGELPFAELEEDFYHPQVTFVCTGNICRSPLAEYYFRQQAEQHGLSWRSASAGSLVSGIPISENSRILLAEDGIDASGHLSTQVNQELMRRSRLVLTLAAHHKNSLLNSGWRTDHVFTLAEYVGKTHDVEDPYQQALEEYRIAYGQIKYYIDILVQKLLEDEK